MSKAQGGRGGPSREGDWGPRPRKFPNRSGSNEFCGHFPCENKLILQALAMLSGRVFDSRPRGCEFEPHRRHCVVVFEQYTLILA